MHRVVVERASSNQAALLTRWQSAPVRSVCEARMPIETRHNLAARLVVGRPGGTDIPDERRVEVDDFKAVVHAGNEHLVGFLRIWMEPCSPYPSSQGDSAERRQWGSSVEDPEVLVVTTMSVCGGVFDTEIGRD